MEDVRQWTALVVFDAEDSRPKALATGFHAFLKEVLKGYKFASVRNNLLDVPTAKAGASSAIVLSIWPEGFTDVLIWLQVHRPPPLTTVVVPLKSQGYEHQDILQRSLWLGHQPEVSAATMEALPALLTPADPPTGSRDTLNPSKGWGHGPMGAPTEMVELRDRAATSLIHFHAHIFVDPADVAGTTPAWKEFYALIADTFKDHKYVVEDQIIEGPIGPHPVSQFEIVFFRPAYQEFLAWLLVNRPAQLPTLIHPMLYNTSVAEQLYGGYYDHSRRAIWLGKQDFSLDLDMLATSDENVRAGVERPYGRFASQRPRGQEGNPAIDITA